MIKRIETYFFSNYKLVDNREYYLKLSIVMGMAFTVFVFLFDPYENYAYPLKYNIPISLVQIGYGINLTLVIYTLSWFIFLKIKNEKVNRPWKTYQHWLLLIAIELISGFSGTIYHRILTDVGEVKLNYYMSVTVPRSILIGIVLFIICFLHGKLYEKNKRLELLQNDKTNNEAQRKKLDSTLEKFVLLKSPVIKQTLKIDPTNIIYLKAFGNYVEIHTKDEEKTKLMRAPLHYVAQQLSPYSFITKCHRQYYVNVLEAGILKRRILSIKDSQKTIPVSKKYNKEIKSILSHSILN